MWLESIFFHMHPTIWKRSWPPKDQRLPCIITTPHTLQLQLWAACDHPACCRSCLIRGTQDWAEIKKAPDMGTTWSGNLSSAQLDLDAEVWAKSDRSLAKKKHASSRNQFSVRFFFKVLFFFQQKCLLALYHPTRLSDFNPVPHSPWEKHFIASSFPRYGSSCCHWLWVGGGEHKPSGWWTPVCIDPSLVFLHFSTYLKNFCDGSRIA